MNILALLGAIYRVTIVLDSKPKLLYNQLRIDNI